MNKKYLLILLLLAGTITVWGLFSIFKTIVIKRKGTQIKAIVTRVVTNCDKYNKIEVVYQAKTYEVNIARNDCRDGIYKTGQIVTLLKYKDYDQLVWPESQIEWLPVLFIALIILIYYSNKEKFKG